MTVGEDFKKLFPSFSSSPFFSCLPLHCFPGLNPKNSRPKFKMSSIGSTKRLQQQQPQSPKQQPQSPKQQPQSPKQQQSVLKPSSSDVGFFQETPRLRNQFQDDIALQRILSRMPPFLLLAAGGLTRDFCSSINRFPE